VITETGDLTVIITAMTDVMIVMTTTTATAAAMST
jgi:hypothetical protein